MNKLQVYKPQSFSDFVNFVLKKQSENKNALWFRGCGRSKHKLIPALFRHKKISKISDLISLEYQLLTRFKQRSIPFHNKSFDDDWYTLFFMQHYGIPTRLLDWTENPFIAFYFAVMSAHSEIINGKFRHVEDASIWLLDPTEWNRFSLKNISFDLGILSTNDEPIKSYKPIQSFQGMSDFPVALFGAHNSARIVSQRGVFMIFGQNIDPMEDLVIRKGFPSSSLIKIILKKSKLSQMRKDILNNGFTESVVFPDLEGLSKEIRRTFGFED